MKQQSNLGRGLRFTKVDVLIVLFIFGTLTIGSHAPQPVIDYTPPESQKWALLIGINDYVNADIQDLRGCETDIKNMRDILLNNFGFPGVNIKMLLGKEATKENIRQTVNSHLLANNAIAQGDIVAIYYSGHGSQQLDKNDEEPDGWDETIVPYDAQAGVDDITDDEIGGWLSALRKKRITNLTLIFDSCHSGSATRDPSSAVRYTPPKNGAKGDTRSPNTPTYAKGIRASDWMTPESGYTLISGCMHYENSHEFSINGEKHGVLSYYLQEALTGMNQNMTYGELVDAVRIRIEGTGYRNRQHPTVEGDLNKQVFSGIRVVRPPYFRITSIKDNQVKIDAGTVHLMTKGSILGVYPKEAERFEGEKNCIAKLIVEEVSSTSSKCRLVNAADSLVVCSGTGKLSVEGKAAELLHNFGTDSLAVSIDRISNRSLRQTITARLQKLPIKLTGMEKAEAFFSIQGDSILGPLMDTVCVRTRDPKSAEYQAQVETEFLRLAQRKNLSQLKNDNPNSKMELKVEVEKLTQDSDGEIIGTEKLTTSEQEGQMQMTVGQAFRLRITNRSPISVWIAVLDLQTDGGVGAIYPPIEGARDNELHPDSSFVIPHDGLFRITKPLGVETMKVIGTTKWSSFKVAEIPGCESEDAFDHGGIKAPSSPLVALFAHPLMGLRAGYERIPIDDWTAASIRFEVVEGSDTEKSR